MSDREQTRRDAENWLSDPTAAPLARRCLALLAELEQTKENLTLSTAAFLAESDRLEQAERESEANAVKRKLAEAKTLDALTAKQQAEQERDKALVAFYRVDPVGCAHICDDVLDTSGALLGRVREMAK